MTISAFIIPTPLRQDYYLPNAARDQLPFINDQRTITGDLWMNPNLPMHSVLKGVAD